MTYDGNTIVDEYDLAQVMFETGYPYIGMTKVFFDKFATQVKRNVPDMDCTAGSHWGICRVPNTRCEQLNLKQDFKFTMRNNDFTIPLDYSPRKYCSLCEPIRCLLLLDSNCTTRIKQ